MRREFVANVSHELRTPLASIRLLVETLEAGAAQDAEVAASLFRQAVAEIDHLTGLVDELLDLARLESGHLVLQLDERDPGELLVRAADRLRPQSERAGVELRVASSAGIGLVRVDQGRIEQALLNLIHNAIKFTPAGGTITLSAEARGELVRLAVADTGVGIPAEELPRIFERFYKRDSARRSPGTGLGLAIAKHIAQAHGGAIGAESTPGHGTTIWIDLPLASATHPTVED
jgi:two-component system phosphate regulon sensor histidine kinase PhoR